MRTLRAISPVVATTLLIIIAVVTAVVLYLWVSGTVQNQPTQQTKLQEAIKIDAVKFDSNKLTVYVRNVGNVKVNLSAAYVIDVESNNILCQNTTDRLSNVQIAPGNTTSITISNCSNAAGKTVLVKVVTRDGVEATYLTTLPSS